LVHERIIAVIDDDHGMRVSLGRLLLSVGYRTVLFESAEAFLSAESRLRVDCVISDIAIPGGMSGLDLARCMANGQSEIPLVLMSGRATPACRHEAETLGVTALLAKPFDDGELVGLLDKALSDRSQADS